MGLRSALALCAVTIVVGCGGETNESPPPLGTPDAAAGGGADTQRATGLTIEGGAAVLKTGAFLQLRAMAAFGADTRDVTAEAAWTSSDAALATVTGGTVTAVAPGSVTITATFDGQTQSTTLSVEQAALTGLVIAPQLDAFTVGVPEDLTVTAVFDSGAEEDVTARVQWETSNPDIATVNAEGVVEATHGGPLTLTATLDGQSATLQATVGCDYPRYARTVQFGGVMPPLSWNDAYRPDGSKFDFKLEDVYCDVAYKDVTALFFIVSAGWCTPCTLYAQRLLTQYAAIERAGGLIAIVEAQTTDFAPADNDFAQRHLSRIIGDAYAIRIGSHDSQPVADFLHTQDIVQSFPTTIAVRTRDMRIITDSNRSQYYLPLAQIAADPEADWSNPSAPPFVNNCGEGDEELTEPNDSPRQAAPLEPGTLGGGICTTDGDFYAISLEGPWSLSVEFDSTLGDIDVYVWDTPRDQPLQSGGDVVGSNGTTGVEAFDWQGPATVVVQGYQGASAPYAITLQAR